MAIPGGSRFRMPASTARPPGNAGPVPGESTHDAA